MGPSSLRLRHVRQDALLAVLGAMSGALAGIASYVFLELLEWATNTPRQERLARVVAAGRGPGDRDRVPPLGWPGARRHGPGSRRAARYTVGAPARMAPMVLVGTVVGHLFGASVGREGTAVQMSSSITEGLARAVRLDHAHRATLARAALAGGFGSVFGVPFAGVVFAMEVARRRTVRALVACVPAAFVGHAVVSALGHHHDARPHVQVPFSFGNLVLLVALGWVFGATARAFALGVPALKQIVARLIRPVPLRPVVGGLATAALFWLVGGDYLGLSVHLLDSAFSGISRDWYDAPLKLVFTAIALGTGFVGGEVTPLFVIGGTLGSALADPLGLSPVTATALGLVAVFGAAAHVPFTCAVMAVELFGAHAFVPAVVVCVVARVVAGGESIYAHPVVVAPAPHPPDRAHSV
ncbi:MAG: chloride channel protein [Ilumatobacteraceae bacterium]